MNKIYPHGVTPSEKFVAHLCEQSFLKLWTHPNPTGKHGRELCDCLIVCGPNIIIISVKENKYKETGDITGWERWTKAAIEKSANQIWGAERWLETVNEFIRHDGRIVTLPPKTERRYHRVSVSLGGRRQVPIAWGELINGFVLICDENSLSVVFSVLDTITDFIDFIIAVEALGESNTRVLIANGGNEDLLALYLSNGRSFKIAAETEGQPDYLIIHDDLWKSFSTSKDYTKIKSDLLRSYDWDKLIELFTDDLLTDKMFDMYDKQVTNNELALVSMALQPRRTRSFLARAFVEFLEDPERNIASRVVQGFGQTAFVF